MAILNECCAESHLATCVRVQITNHTTDVLVVVHSRRSNGYVTIVDARLHSTVRRTDNCTDTGTNCADVGYVHVTVVDTALNDTRLLVILNDECTVLDAGLYDVVVEYTRLVDNDVLHRTRVQIEQTASGCPILQLVALTIENTRKVNGGRGKSYAREVDICTDANLTLAINISRIVAGVYCCEECVELLGVADNDTRLLCACVGNLRHSEHHATLNLDTCGCIGGLLHCLACCILDGNLEALGIRTGRDSEDNGCLATLVRDAVCTCYADIVATCVAPSPVFNENLARDRCAVQSFESYALQSNVVTLGDNHLNETESVLHRNLAVLRVTNHNGYLVSERVSGILLLRIDIESCCVHTIHYERLLHCICRINYGERCLNACYVEFCVLAAHERCVNLCRLNAVYQYFVALGPEYRILLTIERAEFCTRCIFKRYAERYLALRKRHHILCRVCRTRCGQHTQCQTENQIHLFHCLSFFLV